MKKYNVVDCFLSFFKHSSPVMLLIDPKDGAILDANQSAIHYYGYTFEELTSMSIYTINTLSFEEIHSEIEHAFKEERNHFNFMHRLASKEIRDVEVYSIPVVIEEKNLLFSMIHDVTEQKRTKAMLLQSEARFRELFQNIPNVSVQGYTMEGITTYWNEASEMLYGYTAQEAIGKNLIDLIIPSFMHEGVKAAISQMAQSNVPIPAAPLQLMRKDGRMVDVFSSHAIVQTPFREPELFCIDIDLSEQKAAEAKLRLAANVFTHSKEGIIITDASGSIIDVNDAFVLITGYTREELIGKNPNILKSDRHSEEYYKQMWALLLSQGHWSAEVWNKHKNGEVYPEMVTISSVKDAQGEIQNYVALYTDISFIKKHEEELERAAHYDALTNLPNRVLLFDRLTHGMVKAQRRRHILAVAYIDLDGFKEVNDQYGHEMGDKVLIEIATQMKATMREGDTLSRLGGDEFVATLIDLEAAQDCLIAVERLLKATNMPLHVDGTIVSISASIGVAVYPNDAEDADQLMRYADQAMYKAKQKGKNRYCLFGEDA
jgi:diguanylate cyclase (GGDEF)-like protein/PAS domain S-box-containing protein